jgi:hypothetical protein
MVKQPKKSPLFDPEAVGPTFLRNVSDCLSIDTALHPTTFGSTCNTAVRVKNFASPFPAFTIKFIKTFNVTKGTVNKKNYAYCI